MTIIKGKIGSLILTLHTFYPYILKAKKFAELPFQKKKIAEKVRVIFGPFWVIFGHFVAFLDKFAESSIFLRFRWSPGTRF